MAFRRFQQEGPINATLDLASDVADTVVDVITFPVDLVRGIRSAGRGIKNDLVSAAKGRRMPPDPASVITRAVDQVIAVPRGTINDISGRIQRNIG